MQPPRDSPSSHVLQKRPTTPGKSGKTPPSMKENSPPVPELTHHKKDDKKEKRSSLAFLRRSKSGDTVRQRPVVPNIPQQAPKLPDLWNGSSTTQPLRTFGANSEIRDSVDIVAGALGIPGMPPSRRSTDTGLSGASSAPGSGYYLPVRSSGRDSSGGEEPINAVSSMAHRGRFAGATGSTVNSPRRVRRRKDPTPFNILIIGARNSGKTSFIQFLRQSLSAKSSCGKSEYHMDPTPEDAPVTSKSTFVKTYLETEIDGERIGLTLWDSQGFEKNIVDLQLRETIAFIESKFEDTFTEETKVVRAPGVRDTHIHCAFHLIDPARLESSIVRSTASSASGNILSGGLDEDLDLQVLRGLKGKTTVVPVISKADTITTAHMNVLKHLVRTSLKNQRLDPLEALDIDLEAYGITPAEVPPNMYMANPIPITTNTDAISNGATTNGAAENGTDHPEGEDTHPRPASASNQTHRPPTSRSSLFTTTTDADHDPDHDPEPELLNLEFVPLSIISPDSYEPGAIGRKFAWGFADPYNAEHCDFVRLKEAVFSDWRGELREASREVWYENWRTSRLSGGVGAGVARGMGSGRRPGGKRR
ncbi:hypothetical protein BDZ91DRAFT_792076 [Kalaharituber pfeilii]|nr:hypothetical protein BDZ91DRAFT_792076 [Kalaharituber pfeilii]